jgi:hypothetical protein
MNSDLPMLPSKGLVTFHHGIKKCRERSYYRVGPRTTAIGAKLPFVE